MNINDIAKIAYEVNRVYSDSIGDNFQPEWEEAPADVKHSYKIGIGYLMNHSFASPAEIHQAWLKYKEKAGWKYGPIEDAAKKEHPCLMPYSMLPAEQKSKDCIFNQIVRSLLPYLSE